MYGQPGTFGSDVKMKAVPKLTWPTIHNKAATHKQLC